MTYEKYMDDYDAYMKLIPVCRCTTCKCEHHCNTGCPECDNCPDCTCKHCVDNKN